jgi:hypothetical protein
MGEAQDDEDEEGGEHARLLAGRFVGGPRSIYYAAGGRSKG